MGCCEGTHCERLSPFQILLLGTQDGVERRVVPGRDESRKRGVLAARVASQAAVRSFGTKPSPFETPDVSFHALRRWNSLLGLL